VISRRTFLFAPLLLTAAARKPNVVLLLASGWRAQAVPWAGDPDLVLPNLEKFGKQAMVFSRAYSCSPTATSALAALRSGIFPHAIDGNEARINDVFKAAGYSVASEIGRQTSPWFVSKFLSATSGEPYDPAALHPRLNVPSEAEPEARRNMASRYAIFSALDQEIGRILMGLSSDTIVIFTADCGEQIGSHGLEGDDVAFEESARIPLAIRFPAVLKSSVSDLLVSQADILPTLLGLCGIDIPERVQGRDLSKLLAGERGSRPESVFSEGKLGQREEWRMLVLGSDKLVVNAQTEPTQLYNLAEDPYELNNIVREPSVQLKRDQLLAALRASSRKLNDFKRR
jgi:arylsulfatase A-like enzyme